MKFEFNHTGSVKSVTYFSKEPVVVHSIWSLVGMHQTYLNQLVDR